MIVTLQDVKHMKGRLSFVRLSELSKAGSRNQLLQEFTSLKEAAKGEATSPENIDAAYKKLVLEWSGLQKELLDWQQDCRANVPTLMHTLVADVKARKVQAAELSASSTTIFNRIAGKFRGDLQFLKLAADFLNASEDVRKELQTLDETGQESQTLYVRVHHEAPDVLATAEEQLKIGERITNTLATSALDGIDRVQSSFHEALKIITKICEAEVRLLNFFEYCSVSISLCSRTLQTLLQR